jgi:hypothetical protein
MILKTTKRAQQTSNRWVGGATVLCSAIIRDFSLIPSHTPAIASSIFQVDSSEPDSPGIDGVDLNHRAGLVLSNGSRDLPFQ